MKKEKLFNYALESLKNGISVIPVGKDKRPLISWKEFQTRYASEEELRGWFENFDDPQIGFVTGKISNLTVVDIEKGGDPSFLPQDTMIVGTGGGGYHYYFNFEDGVNNKARIKELTDIRSEGGYVVAPNSVSDKGSYSLLQDKPLIQFPKELFPKPFDIFAYPETINNSNKLFSPKTLDSYTGFGKGSRNDEMTRYIGYVLTQIHPADWDTEGWNIIVDANKLNTPPLGQNELLSTFNSVKGIERRNNPLGHVRGGRNPLKGFSKCEEPNILEEEGDDVRPLYEVAEAQKINLEDVYPLGMQIFDDKFLGGVCPGDVIVIAGQPGHGKTTLCQDWTVSMIRGIKKSKALWFSYEVLPAQVWKKFKEMGLNKEDCVFIPAKHSTGNLKWVEKKIQEGKEKFGTNIVFIDHLGFLLPKTEGVLGKNLSSNYSTFLTQIMRDLKTIAIKEEIIIFLPVHMKKPNYHQKRSEIEDISGSAGPAQEADLVFLIEREKNTDEKNKSYFTNFTIITLAKNRKTGETGGGRFFIENDRFKYDDSEEEAQEIFNNLKSDEEFEREKESLTNDIPPESDLVETFNEEWDNAINN